MGEDKAANLKRIFIVAPFFPPSPMPPSQRVRLIVKHAASLGYYPTVFTVDPKYREEKQDPWMLELVGNNFDLVTVNCIDQNKTRKVKIGDLGIRMLPSLFFKLKEFAKKQKPLFILYPVPPWYILTIAPLIKRLTNIPYGIDFIDPWVYDLEPSEKVFKKKLSQRIARRFEKWACKNATIIYSVSQGINDDLIKRYPAIKNKTFVAVPYGAEPNDFDLLKNEVRNTSDEKITVRYIGAVWLDSYPVLNALLPALAQTRKIYELQIEFLGTGYAPEPFAANQMNKWFTDLNMEAYAVEDPLRVSYKRAVELTLTSDILLLFGGMLPYYAASKLMGLLFSRKPFVAFVHKDSFPAQLLENLNYPYLVTYSQLDNDTPDKKIELLTTTIIRCIEERKNFKGVDLSHPLIQQHTAYGMTKNFLEPINKNIA